VAYFSHLRLQSRPMCTDRRNFLRLSAGLAGASLLGSQLSYANTNEVEAIQQRQDTPDLIKNLKPMMAGVMPITNDERKARIIKDRGIRSGRVGIEERVRFFLYDGIRQAAPKLEFVSATPITAGCRMYKSPAELALMQKANDITIVAYRATWKTMHEGMTQTE